MKAKLGQRGGWGTALYINDQLVADLEGDLHAEATWEDLKVFFGALISRGDNWIAKGNGYEHE